MISKLLLTLMVIAVAWLVLQHRAGRGRLPSTGQPPRFAAQPNPRTNRVPRLAAYGLILFMMLASGFYLFLQWRDEYRVVTVRVINTQTGETLTYTARRGDVGDRRFETLDGRVVSVAQIERIEIGGEFR